MVMNSHTLSTILHLLQRTSTSGPALLTAPRDRPLACSASVARGGAEQAPPCKSWSCLGLDVVSVHMSKSHTPPQN